MPRIAKADVNKALLNAAKTINEAGGSDHRTSRAEMKKALQTLPKKEAALADSFFKFIDARDFKKGAQVTPKDVQRAVEYAKEHMVAKYDLNNNGLSQAEINKMSLTGKNAVALAKALKGAAEQPLIRHNDTVFDLVDRGSVTHQESYTDPASVPAELAPLMIAAANESTYDAHNLQEVFDLVDQSQVDVRHVTVDGRKLLVVDYGAGDNEFGAIFDAVTKKMVAGIHDGDLEAY